MSFETLKHFSLFHLSLIDNQLAHYNFNTYPHSATQLLAHYNFNNYIAFCSTRHLELTRHRNIATSSHLSYSTNNFHLSRPGISFTFDQHLILNLNLRYLNQPTYITDNTSSFTLHSKWSRPEKLLGPRRQTREVENQDHQPNIILSRSTLWYRCWKQL